LGDRNGIILPYFFISIQITQTRALIEFVRPPAPLRENMLHLVVEEELDLPPPWGATGFEPPVVLEKESVRVIQNGRHVQNERSLLQARLQRNYNQDETSFMEKNLIGLAFQWNKLDSTDTIHIIRKNVSWEDKGSPGQSTSDTFQTRLHGLYSQDTTTNKEMNFMELANKWNNSVSQDEGRESIQNEKIYILRDEEYVKTGDVSKNESGADFQARLQGL